MLKDVLRKALLLFMGALFFITSWSQGRTVTGTVLDDKEAPLSGATITVKNTKASTSTNAVGVFTISVPAGGKTLVVSYVGMQPKEVAIGTSDRVTINLTGNASTLSDVVVVGYGTRRRADVTSSISSISAKDIRNLPVAGVDQAIQGKVSGVTVTNNGGQPGGGVSVRVRGITSVNGNEPLYVVDGVPIMQGKSSLDQSFLGGGSGQTAQSVMATLNPADIESIDILKDASAQAIYGSLGANGVVLITTKHGKAGQGKITYDTYYGVSEIPKKLSVMNLSQYAQYANSLVGEIRAAGGGLDSIGEFKNPAVLGHGTDWQDQIYRRGATMSHQLGFSGGSDKTTYYFSAGYLNQTGTLIETGFKRYTLKANIDHQIRDWLNVGFNTNLSRSDQKIGLSDGFDAVTSTVLYNSPATPVRDVYGNFISTNIIGGSTFGNPNNPVALATLRNVRSVNSNAVGGLYAELKFFKGLSLRNEVNYNFNLTSSKAYQPYAQNSTTGAVILSPSRLREDRNNSLYYGVKNFLNYNGDFGKFAVNGTAGHEVQSSNWDDINANRNNLVLNLPSLNAGTADLSQGIGAGAGAWSMESYFARAGVTFNNKYAITGTVRKDGSSSFGPGKRWGTFPAVSASWTASNEDFLKDVKFLNYLKLRAGYGSVGNQGIGANVYTSNISLIGTAPFGPGGLPSNVANPFVSWEAVKTYNAGIDATMFNKKLEVTVDVYKKVSTEMLLPAILPSLSGLGTAWNDIQVPTTNDGQMTNTGIDLGITSYNIQSKDFRWTTSVTFSHYKNILDRLNSPNATIPGQFNEYGTLSLVSLTQQGRAVGSFYGYVTDGLFKSEKELNNGIDYGLAVKPDGLWIGDIRYKDLNGDKKIDDKDVAAIGNPNPKFTYGMTNTVSWKSFDFSLFVYGSYGAKIFNYTRRQTEAMNSPYNNQLTTVLDRFTASNPNGTLPRYNQWSNNNLRISDRYIEDGSFFRIQNLQLGYNLPKELVNKAKFGSAKVFVSVQNLHTFTKYSGYDPELGALNNNATFMNVDNGHYPNPRTFTVGANIQF